MPERIQRRRTKGWRMPEGAIYVGRPTRWGNPFEVGTGVVSVSGTMYGARTGRYDPADPRWYNFELDRGMSVDEAVALYRHDLLLTLDDDDEVRSALGQLRGHDLVCWCPLVDAKGNPVPCHADVLLELANR